MIRKSGRGNFRTRYSKRISNTHEIMRLARRAAIRT